MFKNKQKRASFLIISSFFLANLLLLLILQGLQAKPIVPVVSLSGSQKLVDQPTAHPGDSLQYTIIVSNSSAITITASLIDPLPTGLTVESGTLTATLATTLTAGTQAITWVGTIAGYEMITVSFAASISSSFSVGESVVNTAVLTGTGQATTITATTELVNFQLYLPFITRALSTPSLQPIQLTCNSDNWTVNWSNADTGVMYELQEAHDAAFTNPTTYNTANLSQAINQPASPDNLYYYRVSSNNGTVTSPWSNSVNVVGNYLDGFSDPNSGWIEIENTIGRFSYENDAYQIESKQAGFLLSSLSPDVNRDGYIVEADIHWQTNSPTNGIYGLIFGANDDITKYYFLAVYADSQEYWLFFFDSTLPIANRLRPIFPSRLSSAVINPGHATNHAQITRIGSNIEVAINNVTLGNWTDNAQTGNTRAGFLVTANPNDPKSTALFDNFKLSACGSATAVITPALRQTAVPIQSPAILPQALFNPTP